MPTQTGMMTGKVGGITTPEPDLSAHLQASCQGFSINLIIAPTFQSLQCMSTAVSLHEKVVTSERINVFVTSMASMRQGT